MSWDNATAAVARALDERDTTWHLGGPIKKFVEGAKWQRADLRTDEAVERVAEAIYRSHDSYTHFTAKPWDEMVTSKDRANKFRVKQDRKAARAAIDALLGQEPRP